MLATLTQWFAASNVMDRIRLVEHAPVAASQRVFPGYRLNADRCRRQRVAFAGNCRIMSGLVNVSPSL